MCPPTPFSVHVCLAAGEAGVEFVQIKKKIEKNKSFREFCQAKESGLGPRVAKDVVLKWC